MGERSRTKAELWRRSVRRTKLEWASRAFCARRALSCRDSSSQASAAVPGRGRGAHFRQRSNWCSAQTQRSC
eukprot:SAG11_NODE_22367_length_407_cov_0.957792_1_plen_71_part_01